MLIIEIAVGVFLGGLGLWMLVLRREKKKQAKHDEDQVQEAFNAAESYVKQSFETVTATYHDDVRRKLVAILDDPNSSIVGAFTAELQSNLSSDHFSRFKTQVVSKAPNALKDSFSKAARIGASERLKQHIDQLASSACELLQNESGILLCNEIASINDDDLPSITQGHPRKQCILGNAFRLGKNVQQDYPKARRLLRLSAEQGYVAAQAILGEMYYNGEGLTQDYPEALKWFRLAAAQEDAFAQNCLGLIYANGYGVKQDYKEAMKWHHLSAAQGFAPAQINIGAMYCAGEGVEKDYVRARMWFICAMAKDGTISRDNLWFTDKLMTPDQIEEAEKLALDKDKSTLQFLLRLSESLLVAPLSTYRDSQLLADYFTEGYVATIARDKKYLALPTPSEIEQWSITESELCRCTEECVLLAAMGVVVTVKNNMPSDRYAAFILAFADRIAALLSWQDREGAAGEIKKVIEYYIDALENERIVEFACTYTERVFSGNRNESAIFAANFWDRAFAVGMATMGASRGFFAACMAEEMSHGARVQTAVS